MITFEKITQPTIKPLSQFGNHFFSIIVSPFFITLLFMVLFELQKRVLFFFP